MKTYSKIKLMVYLDWAATTPPDPEVIGAMAHSANEYYGNPSSSYREGIRAHDALNNARKRCSIILGCHGNQLIFTSGGTESNAIVLFSLLLHREPGNILLSGFEHPSVSEPVKSLKSHGWKAERINPNARGIIEPKKLLTMLERYPDTRLIAIMGVHNETGIIQPIDELTSAVQELGRKRKIHFHVDLVQAVGKIPINLEECQFDTASFGAHKFRGPRGIGLLYHRHSNFDSLFHGGGQEFGIRPGTENVAGATAMALALERYGQPSEGILSNGTWLSRQIADLPGAHFIPENRHSANNASLFVPGIIAVSFPPVPGEVLARVLEQSGFSVSTGSACHNNQKDTLPPSLTSLKIPKALAEGMIRISIGSSTTRSELEGFIVALKTHLGALKNQLTGA